MSCTTVPLSAPLPPVRKRPAFASWNQLAFWYGFAYNESVSVALSVASRACTARIAVAIAIVHGDDAAVQVDHHGEAVDAIQLHVAVGGADDAVAVVADAIPGAVIEERGVDGAG